MSANTQAFCVRWNSHLGSIGAAFPQLLAGQGFVDVTVACEGHEVHCHRLVLACDETAIWQHWCSLPTAVGRSEICGCDSGL
nr:broad-complex core protein isoforms 1/2/3/4/5-like [Drosophila virilis]